MTGLRPREIAARESDAIFCEALANGHPVAVAGRIAGISKSPAHRKFKRICAELGWQAR